MLPMLLLSLRISLTSPRSAISIFALGEPSLVSSADLLVSSTLGSALASVTGTAFMGLLGFVAFEGAAGLAGEGVLAGLGAVGGGAEDVAELCSDPNS